MWSQQEPRSAARGYVCVDRRKVQYLSPSESSINICGVLPAGSGVYSNSLAEFALMGMKYFAMDSEFTPRFEFTPC